MPDSPETKVPNQNSMSPPNSMSGGTTHAMRDIPRPISGSSIVTSMNGAHSPLGSINGRTPSPPSVPYVSSSQQLPPACGARQLSKLKRFLTTLQQFGSDISPEIGERVRTLVLGLVNSHLSIEEFHAKLQEATNFPLRPFVIPFLKANLPLLQRELLHCARMAKQTPQQYLAQNEHVLFNPSHSPIGSHDSPGTEFNENGKRTSPDRPRENGMDQITAKRHQPISPQSNSRVSPNGVLNLNAGPIRLEDISLSREIREREKLERVRAERERLERDRERERDHHFTAYGFSRPDSAFDTIERLDDDWRHVETMLNCIMGMIDKTKRAIAVLQERSLRDREELSMWVHRHTDGDIDKKRGDSFLRTSDDRVAEIRRRAEEAVQEVKRQAMIELQKAVSAADAKASELVANERSKMDRALLEARKQAQEELLNKINHQEESSESCWNCGRKASETCSGCNTARYCGSFCQHKDWENHHHVCGKVTTSGISQMNNPALQSTQATKETTSPSPLNLPSPANSISSAKSPSRSSSPPETRACEVSR
ncbi:hypothetical protein ACJMK2_010883 [Sinanodonta woodiana]|uniref:Uncharacterized protein n=1 Tax=Sinanodonta woodiana TaxID=1069815 RepID=A0ABD3VGZ0_SINWO